MSSNDLALSVRGVSKAYTIAHNVETHTTIAEALLDRVKHPFRRAEEETFWALRDVDFDIKKGDVVGIIGRNGAGKSTLLKILSEITEPTRGEVRLFGRVGSLLEVGTGFHPELTGRENIHLNGAILGMSRREIVRQFDAIVDFAGTEQFLDTPVKRYSSGMYVRLAFAVAAHLNPEILVVDEVLAVGDSEFQRKCLGKMEDASKQDGRTILFVSHNMAAIRTLCSRGLYLREGRLLLDCRVEDAIDEYLSGGDLSDACIAWAADDPIQSPELRLLKATVLSEEREQAAIINLKDGFTIEIEYEVRQTLRNAAIGIMIQNHEGVLMCGSTDSPAAAHNIREPGRYVSRCYFPGHVLNSGVYSVLFGADAESHAQQLVRTPYCLRFTVEDMQGHAGVSGRLPGLVRPNLVWDVEAAPEAPRTHLVPAADDLKHRVGA
jgi:lipopolysaccharide transport system ATP-binding protein